MGRTYIAQLGRRQSAALLAATAAAIAAAALVLGSLFLANGTVFAWCRNFILAEPAGRSPFSVVASASGVALLAASSVSFAVFVLREAFAAMRLRRMIMRRMVAPPGRVAAAAAAAGVGEGIVAVRDDERFAFTAGIFRPMIVVSSGLVSSLTLKELKAVLRHEEHHRLHRHPLRSLGWEALRRWFFFLPSLKDVADHFALGRELAADRDASACYAEKRPLAAALYKTAAPRTFFGAAVAPFGHFTHRVRALSGELRGTPLRLSFGRAVATFAATFVFAGIHAWASPAFAGGPETAPQCRSAEGAAAMSTVNFSPYIRIRYASASSTAPVVQSREIGP